MKSLFLLSALTVFVVWIAPSATPRWGTAWAQASTAPFYPDPNYEPRYYTRPPRTSTRPTLSGVPTTAKPPGSPGGAGFIQRYYYPHFENAPPMGKPGTPDSTAGVRD
jgi:hypothetical protein